MEYNDRHLDYYGASYLDTGIVGAKNGEFGIYVGDLDNPESTTHLVYLDEAAQRELRDELNKSLGEEN